MHRVVNGVKVYLTPEEVAQLELEWAEADQAKANDYESERVEHVRQLGILKGGGLSKEVVSLMRPDLNKHLNIEWDKL